MSYLEMASASLPNMSSGIISIWFREVTKNTAPDADTWPSGVWVPGTTSMVPPWTQAIVQDLQPSSIFFWDAYGLPLDMFGGALTGPAAVWMPTPPPFATDTIHMLLSFGDPKQPYKYWPWRMDTPSVTKAVNYTGSPVPGLGFQPEVWPPPYAPYFVNIGDDGGKFTVSSMRLEASLDKPDMVPQSFIGVDKDGYIIICLQTNTRADYKGYAFEQSDIMEMKIGATYLKIHEPYTYDQIGFPFPDGTFVEVPGYWNGYQFEYRDISNEVMSGQPESFVIGGPPVFLDLIGGPKATPDTWHHLLFSFDIGGAVSCEQPDATGAEAKPTMTTACKAWLAMDDHNYTGMELQRRLRIPDGFLMPLLPGMGHDIAFGKQTSYSRSAFSLGPNDIIPQNVWLRSFTDGYPRDGLLRYVSSTGLSTGPPNNEHYAEGDFNGLEWAASLWPLYWPRASGPAFPTADPPRPTVSDPATFDKPTYQCSSFSIPVKGHPIGVPAAARHLKHNTGVEMGELQIWANKTLDTTDVNMRRLFIDHPKNDQGFPDTTKPLQPVPPSVAEEVLGKPDILLHGAGNWKSGSNTGTSGATDNGDVILDGQFSPIAKINEFLPDPELGK